MFPVLETPRLRLRLPEERDLHPFVEIHEDPEVLSYVTSVGESGGRVAGWRTIALLLGHWSIRGYGQWTVVDRVTDEVLGRVGLWNPEGWPGVELGWIIRRSHWNRGLATEAARAALTFTFEQTAVDHVISTIRPDNGASIRVAEKIGLSLERRDVLDDVEILVYGVHRPVRTDSAATARDLEDA